MRAFDMKSPHKNFHRNDDRLRTYRTMSTSLFSNMLSNVSANVAAGQGKMQNSAGHHNHRARYDKEK